MMTLKFISTVLCHLICLVCHLQDVPVFGDSVCGPAEEGTSLQLTCDGVSSDNTDMFRFIEIRWFVRDDRASDRTVVAVCRVRRYGKNSTPCGFCDENFKNIVTEQSSPHCGSTLTVQNISRSSIPNIEAIWQCETNFGEVDTLCDPLEVYAKPESPVCEDPILNISTRELSVTCATEKVYPKAGCRFLYSTDNDSFTEMNYGIIYTHTEWNDTVVYYQSQCTARMPLYLFSNQKIHYVQVLMYPRLRSSSTIVNVSSNVVHFRVPAKPVSPVCDDPIFKVSTNELLLTCVTKKVYPKAVCRFLYSTNNTVFEELSGDVIYNHTAEWTDFMVFYRSQCTVIRTLDGITGQRIYFKVQMHPLLNSSSTSYSQYSNVVNFFVLVAEDQESRVIRFGLTGALATIAAACVLLGVLWLRASSKLNTLHMTETTETVAAGKTDSTIAPARDMRISQGYEEPIVDGTACEFYEDMSFHDAVDNRTRSGTTEENATEAANDQEIPLEEHVYGNVSVKSGKKAFLFFK